MDTTNIISEEWEHVLSLMPKDMGESCKIKLALTRRREVGSASDLLRLCFAYGPCDMSLRQVAAWAGAIGLGQMSDVAVLKRLRAASDWLEHVVAGWFIDRGLTANVPGCRVRIIDATTVSRPGSTGIDWRLHLSFDLQQHRVMDVELTDKYEGETLKRHRVSPDEIILVDRGYAHRQGIGSVLERGAHVVVRAHWNNLPLHTATGKRVDVVSLLETLGPNEVADWRVYLNDGKRQYPMRLVAIKKTEAATEKAKKRTCKEARKKGYRADARSLVAAGYIYVLSDLPAEQLPAVQVLELYRLRWQIELVFKRLKSVLKLNRLRAKDERLARTYLLSKILGALVVEELSGAALSFFPWGFRLPRAAAEPLASACAVV